MSLLLSVQGPAVSGSGASVVKFVDAGTALEIFTGSGFSAVRFTDGGTGTVQDNSGSGFSVVRFTDDGAGVIVNPRVILPPGGGPPPPRKRAKKRQVVDRPLQWKPWSPEPETPEYHQPDRPVPYAPLPLGPVAPSLDPILAPAAARQRARETEARFHAAQDRAAVGHSTIVLFASGVGRVIPPEMLSVLRQLATN